MVDDANTFRDRAKECRRLADSARDPYAKLALLDIARELDEEADKIDQAGDEKGRNPPGQP